MKLFKISNYLFIISLFFELGAFAQVTVTQETISLPTYKNDAPNVMPRFYEGKWHQGVQRRIYPYPMDDQLTTKKEAVNYNILTVENQFIKLGIIPSLGGRIYYALDKTNNYMWFYKNDVVKPSLIGMVGNWISGSNAWGFPHHHGPNTVKPMDYTIENHKDGSKTIWVANTDKRHRMRALVGYTVYPKSSIVEMTIKPQNRTPIANSFLFWTNPSVHVDTTYQVIFPPSVQYVTQHHKSEMTTWPMADRKYNHFDYTDVDISMWKNVAVPSSFFSWNPKEDYFGGYDYGKQAGTAWVGNHHIMPGMKYWADGNNPAGRRINTSLTDKSSQYIELMAGFYTDNQPDYSWMQPYESKAGKMIWFPIRELEGLKYANKNGALNLELNNFIAKARINTTTAFKNAKVVLESKGSIVFEKHIDIGPDKPFSFDVKVSETTVKEDITLTLKNKNGSLLLKYAPKNHQPPSEELPEPLHPPQPPNAIKTIEELYLIGLRFNQFYSGLDPMPYFVEALRRDPNDYRVNTQLGILAIKAKDWNKAENHLQIAVDRITMNYTRPKDGEALYYLGMAQRALGKLEEAYDNFYKATWSHAWHSAAYYQLAELDLKTYKVDKALEHIDRALLTNAENDNMVILKAILLRKLKKYDTAFELLQKLLSKDLMNHWALNELALVQKELGNIQNKIKFEDLKSLMRNEVEAYLELATNYHNCGLYKEAKDVLVRLELEGNTYPLLYYYLGYYSNQLGEYKEALNYYRTAAKMPHNYCFPYRAESITVLKDAMKFNPLDAMASYYLGNLFYELQPNKAIKMWELSRELMDSFYIVHRNLGLAYEEILNDNELAIKSYEKAVAINPNDPRLLFEVDKIYEKNKMPSKLKYELLKENHKTAKLRTETLLRFATRSLETGDYQEAIDIIEHNFFPQLEGEREKQDTYLSAYVIRGMEYLNSNQINKAIADFSKIIEYPVGRFGRARWAQFKFLLGLAYNKIGDTEKANNLFISTKDMNIPFRGSDTEYIYYQGLALKMLGEEKAATDVFTRMLKYAQGNDNNSFFTQFEGGQSEDSRLATQHYIAGLAYQGLENNTMADAEFEKALTLLPSHIWAKVHLEQNN